MVVGTIINIVTDILIPEAEIAFRLLTGTFTTKKAIPRYRR